MIELVAFDGDDTLWHSESEFAVTHERIRALLAPHCPPDELGSRLVEVERRNLGLYGYGAKAFTLSILETALEVAGDRLTSAEVRQILEAGKELLAHPVELCAGASDAVEWAASRWPVIVVTKGDLFHQESKVARSGLGDHLTGIEIVAEKDEACFERVSRRYGVDPTRLVMVGNSLRSDAAPVLALGGAAVHVPYPLTWELELVEDAEQVHRHPRFRVIESLHALAAVLEDRF